MPPSDAAIAADARTREVHVRCEHCAHTWVALYLPQPLALAARVLASLHCPKCAADASRILLR